MILRRSRSGAGAVRQGSRLDAEITQYGAGRAGLRHDAGRWTSKAGLRRCAAAALSALLTVGSLSACGSRADAVTAAEEKAPERVIAISESNAELWLLAGGTLIATSDDAMDLEGLNADAVSLGDMSAVSLEAIAALEPDLLILFGTEPGQKALGEAAEAIGIPIQYTDINGFDDYEAVMTELTALTGRDDLYEENVAAVRRGIDEVIAAVPEDAEAADYLFLHISATKSKVEKNDYFACEIFNHLGLENIASDTTAFDELSLEATVTADPDYIFVVPRGNEEKAMESYAELFSGQPAWASLSAVQNGRVYLLSKDAFGLKPNAAWAEVYRQAYDLLYAP